MAKIAPKTTFSWTNNSQISTMTSVSEDAPIILVASTSDKGTEDLKLVSGSAFFKEYVSDKKSMYTRHGQPLLQAAAVAEAGGKILFKRIVAEDSKLANAIVSVKATKVPDTPGQNPGDPSIPPAPGTPHVTLKIQVDTLTDATTMNEVKAHAATLESTASDNEKTYPLFVFCDTGRGASDKRFRITPDYSSARELTFMRYSFTVLEGTTKLEEMQFSLDPNIEYNGENFGLNSVVRTNSTQLKAYVYEDNIEALAEYVAQILDTDKDTMLLTDILGGTSRNGIANPEIEIDVDSINLNNTLGVSLLSGDNGSFTDKPILNGGDPYTEALVDVFAKEEDNELFDVDKYQIDAVFDANYPDEVKKAIEELAVYRTDFMFFRDLGFVYTYDQIKAKADQVTPTYFVAMYHNSYDIIDPYTKKQIPVTVTYSLAKLFINHFTSGKANPFEGIRYNIILSDAIEGTVNYLPRKLKSSDQKQALVDINVNYASYYGDTFVIETQFTADLQYTQLSWLNNVILVQEIVKMLREYCPRTRYTFIDGDGNGDTQAFDNYKKSVEERLNEYKGNFTSLEFEWQYDETQVQNKIFYATIKFAFRNFIESEHFNLFAINTSN
jgi:hypothetical protein